jgi:hypothetical protein
MKAQKLKRKVDDLSDKISDAAPGGPVHVDFESFSDAEKLLFQKVDEVEREYLRTGNNELLVKNADLILKNREVIVKRVTELYCHVVPTVLGFYGKPEIVEYFFKLHFLNFDADLAECLTHVRTWSEKDCEAFLVDLKRTGGLFFRLPRGFNEYNDRNLARLKKSKKVRLDSALDQKGGS